jgi:hypothetical protein
MSKLFKLKEWLPISSAVDHLSKIFDEPVTATDVYQLAIDGHLVLTVRIINSCYAMRGDVVSYQNIKFKTILPPLGNGQKICTSTLLDESKSHTEARFFTMNDQEELIDGLWDLHLDAGAALLYLNSVLQTSNSGPEITGLNLEGIFVTNDEGKFALLYEDDDGITFPSDSLPAGTELVVRIKSIQDLIALVIDPKTSTAPSQPKHINSRAECAYKRLVAALLEYIDGRHGEPNPQYVNDAQLITSLVDRYQGYDGLSKRTLEDRLPDCRKSLS